MPSRERAFTANLRMDLGLLPNWTWDDYRQECAGLLSGKRFEAMAADGRNLVVYDRRRMERETALSLWKKMGGSKLMLCENTREYGFRRYAACSL